MTSTPSLGAEPGRRPPSGIRVTTPPGWWDLPLDPVTRKDDIVSLVDRRLDPDDAAERTAVIEMLEQAAATAHAAGAVLASQFGVVGAGVEFAANMVVALRRVASGDRATLAEQVAELGRGSTEGTTETRVEVETVHLHGLGDVTRRRCDRRVRLSPDASLTVVCVQYFAPVPGSPAVGIVTFTSPTLSARGELCALFDAVASTLEFDYKDIGPDRCA
ncbi:MAG TPA: hypothetical protein VG184_06670 [Acidimicrobiales bacterium]|jgi:hypothetical protein|nr:hypothetical protein [Acidimicrobiales bacterium]